MSREIKFRMWRDGRMQGVHTMYSKASESDAPCEPQNFAFSEEEILMQYTGLKDRNGKEIYEGDIVTSPRSYPCPHQVVWHNSSWDLYHTNEREPFFITEDDWRRMEVIGNIHENPDLLK